MVLLISYDLIGRERPSAYEAVRRAIEANAPNNRKVLYSQWLVETTATPERWREALQGVIDSNDQLFIARVRANEYDGWLPEELWQWLRTYV